MSAQQGNDPPRNPATAVIPSPWYDDPDPVRAAIVGAYWRGRLDEREHLAERSAEVDAVWTPPAARTWAGQVANRTATFERCAAKIAERMGRPEGWRYRGGAVNWESAA